MPGYTMPFPGRELAMRELTYDPCYEKIPEEDRAGIVDTAWKKGEAAAYAAYEEYHGERDFFRIAEDSGLKILTRDTDYVVGSQRYFSDYLSGQNEINLYLKSIALWAEQNHMEPCQAQNMILSHEYFHFLECTKLGLTSRDYQVPMLRIGPLKIGRVGIRALSEIGAHAFARTYYQRLEQEEQGNERTTV